MATDTGEGGGRLLAGVIGLVIAALVVAAGVLGSQVWRERTEADRRAEAVQAARQNALNMSSLDYKNIQQGIDRVLSGMTGEAKNQWGTIAKTIVETATKTQSTSTVQSVKAGVVSMDGDSAEVIVAVTSITTSPKAKDGATRNYRWVLDLSRTDGRWLVTKLGLVP